MYTKLSKVHISIELLQYGYFTGLLLFFIGCFCLQIEKSMLRTDVQIDPSNPSSWSSYHEQVTTICAQ